MTGQPDSTRTANWGADLPANEEEARERLLIAAERCYHDRGPTRTRMSDIALAAGVHRSTVYYYFPNKDAVLAASFVRALAAVFAVTEPCWHTDEPFLDQLVAACLIGNDAVRSSPTMRLLIGDDELRHTYRVAEASEVWRNALSDALGQRISAAAAAGMVRDDLPPQTLARWVTRINFSLIAEPGKPEDGGDEGLLRHLLTASLSHRPRPR